MEPSQSNLFFFLPYLSQDSEPRTKELQQSERRAWAAKQGHRKRKEIRSMRIKFSNSVLRTIPNEQNRPKPVKCMVAPLNAIHFTPQHSHREARSLQFFCERTSVEWSGWCDREFWSSLAPQAAASYPAINHALISLGAYHESLEAPLESNSAACRALSVQQGNHALACLMEDHGQMSLPAILSCYVIVTEFAAILGDLTYMRTSKMQYDIMDEIRRQGLWNNCRIPYSDLYYIFTYLEPLIEKRRSKAGYLIDPLYSLRITPPSDFYVSEPFCVPASFNSLWQARDSLASLLNRTTYAVKIGHSGVSYLPREWEECYEQWLDSLQKLKHNQKLSGMDWCTWQILRVTSKIAFIMIRTMCAEDEMIFDQYEDDYRDFATVATHVLARDRHRSMKSVCFSLDSGFLSLAGWIAQRWCRDPTIRRQLVDILFAAHGRNGAEDAGTWAQICQRIQLEEESGISPGPLRCHDIPLEKRVRIHQGRFYRAAKQLCITVLRPPYDEKQRSNTQDFWIPLLVQDLDTQQEQELTEVEKDAQPNMVVGRGFTSFTLSGDHCTVKAPRFIFPIPRM